MIKKREAVIFGLSKAVLFCVALVVYLIKIESDWTKVFGDYFDWMIFLMDPGIFIAIIAVFIFRIEKNLKRFGKPTYTFGKSRDYRLEIIFDLIYLAMIVFSIIFKEPSLRYPVLRHLNTLLVLGMVLFIIEIIASNRGMNKCGIYLRGGFLNWDEITSCRMEEKRGKRWKLYLSTDSHEFKTDYEITLVLTSDEKAVILPYIQEKTRDNPAS